MAASHPPDRQRARMKSTDRHRLDPSSQVSAQPSRLPAFRPLLPDAEQLLPYLRRIDAARVYSNHGPLVAELQQLLGLRLGLGAEQFLCAGSGTAALVAAVLAAAGRASPARPYALCPAYTFVGTASALQQCGYTPWLVDVDPATWQIDPGALRSHPRLAQTGVVVPVAAYGRAVMLDGWERFRESTGIPVAVDGAASFEAMLRSPQRTAGAIPVALSFHATKAFATGEGGAVVSRDDGLARAAFRALNFGFCEDRESRSPSINGKMSEYHAAVGLAGLAQWEARLLAFTGVAGRYRAAFAAAGLERGFHGSPDVAANYALFHFEDATQCAAAQRALEAEAIETRLWYGRGLHCQPALRHLPRDRLDRTEGLAPSLLGLPMAPDLQERDVHRVVSRIAQALACDHPAE